jgi:hypothetical protein
MRKRKLDNAVDTSGEKKGTKHDILNLQFKQGDLTWVEIHESSWWPAQVKQIPSHTHIWGLCSDPFNFHDFSCCYLNFSGKTNTLPHTDIWVYCYELLS